MKRITFTITFCLILMAINVYGKNNKSNDDFMASDTLVINDASLFCEVNFSIHGIAFDNQELLQKKMLIKSSREFDNLTSLPNNYKS